ncbi:hypothetical protein CXF76_04525 [Pseudoalteromonas sp. 78C3]|uniref:hypothetical protein n=1 Tax=Pseudoalteromonas sp. 78C3 TaxID=2058300 RepID=UPI000C336D13|nr:hypothetical protein [Pseudoalteromonas sp. 78C3]PKH92790.1 hypothetical protein CXF76_04525 [Pseudoalteromonas sp. 78C3]
MKLYLCLGFELEGQMLECSLAELNKMIGVSSRDFKNCLDELEQKNLIRLAHNVSVIKRGCSPQKVILLGEVKEFLVQSYDEKLLADIQKILALKNSKNLNGLNESKLMIKEKALLLFCLLIKDSVAMSEKYIRRTFGVKAENAYEKFNQLNLKLHCVVKIHFENNSRIFKVEKIDSYQIVLESFQVTLLLMDLNKEPSLFTGSALNYSFNGFSTTPSLFKLSSLVSDYLDYYRIDKMNSEEPYTVDKLNTFGFSDEEHSHLLMKYISRKCRGFNSKTDLFSNHAELKLTLAKQYTELENTKLKGYISALKAGRYSDAYLEKVGKSVVKLIFKKDHYLFGYCFLKAVCTFYVLFLKRLEKRLQDDFYQKKVTAIYVNDEMPTFFNIRIAQDKKLNQFLFQNRVFKI